MHLRFSLLSFITTALAGSFVLTANAQIDPSSALLLNTGARSASKDSGLDSGRYTVRPRDGAKREDARTPKRPVANGNGDGDAVASDGGGAGVLVPPTAAATPAPQSWQREADEPARAKAGDEPTPVTVLVGEPGAPDVRRFNLLEISVAPSYLYVDSSSVFTYRNYNTSSPGISAEAFVWLTSTFSLHTSYLVSLSGHVSDSLDGSKNTSAAQQWFQVGLQTRKFFGETALDPSLSLGLDYVEYDFRVPADADIRARLKSTGVLLSLGSEVPTSTTHAWTLGLGIAPKLQHKENSNATEFSSGGSVDANAVTFSLGGKLRFDRESTLFWKVSHTVEKDLFAGNASGTDPANGKTPSTVSVTNSVSVFQLGYTWGN